MRKTVVNDRVWETGECIINLVETDGTDHASSWVELAPVHNRPDRLVQAMEQSGG
ncbi:hypothetical protein M3665_23455 [Bacillus licheniformis]|jgi:hypothetical protein|nr:hypothetical protein [Bacillus licheniformis]